MSRHSKATDPKRNAQLAWLSEAICKGRTDVNIILEMMQIFPGVSEKSAREMLKELYQRYSEINSENMPEQRNKFLELGFTLLEEMRNAFQYGPAANHFKTLSQISGIMIDKVSVDQTITDTTAPKADVLRDRISKLSNDPKIRERAKRLGLDLDDVKLDD